MLCKDFYFYYLSDTIFYLNEYSTTRYLFTTNQHKSKYHQIFRSVYKLLGVPTPQTSAEILHWMEREKMIQSIDDAVDDLIIICQKNGGQLAWFSITELTLTFRRLTSGNLILTKISDKGSIWRIFFCKLKIWQIKKPEF